MIEFVVPLILAIALVFAVYTLMGTLTIFIINIAIFGLLTARINHDTKKEGILYYLISAFLTAFIFVFKDYFIFPFIFKFFELVLILELTVALIFIYLLAHLVKFLHLYAVELLSRDRK